MKAVTVALGLLFVVAALGFAQAGWNHGVSNIIHAYGAPDVNISLLTTAWTTTVLALWLGLTGGPKAP